MSGNRNAKGGSKNGSQNPKKRTKGGASQGSQAKKRSKGRNRGRGKRVDPEKYWGTLEALPAPSEHTTASPDPSVVITSLGRPPIPGHENASKHYFSLVYDRAANLAVALAAAGRLDDWENHPLGPEPDPEPVDEGNTVSEPPDLTDESEPEAEATADPA